MLLSVMYLNARSVEGYGEKWGALGITHVINIPGLSPVTRARRYAEGFPH